MTSQQPDEPAPPDEQPRLEAAASGSGTVFQAGRDQHLHFADGASAAARVRGETVPGVCPYPGLAAFGPEQQRWFFGRDRATAVLCQRLDAKLAGAGLTDTGLNNTGLNNTGLKQHRVEQHRAADPDRPVRGREVLAAARRADPGPGPGQAAGGRLQSWPRPVLTPTAHPVRALARALSPVTGGEPDRLAEAWLANPDECLASVRRALAADAPPVPPVPPRPPGPPSPSGAQARAVILVDQFEEVFTLCTDEPERRAFIDLLDRLAARPADVSSADEAEPAALVLISVRADSYADCLRYRSLRAALQASPVLLDPMTAAELRQAVLFPAQDVGLEVEPGLIEVLLRDAGVAGDEPGDAAGYPAGRLPLLAHALRATWQQHEGHRLTVHGYQVTGGISNAVATSADREFAGLDEAGQQAARVLFLRLVKIGDGTEDVCRRVSRAGLVRDIPRGPGGAVLDAFTHARLLTQDQDTVSITHEVLLRAWPRLRTWLDEDRAGNLIRQDLEAAASTWDRDLRAAEALYRGGRLDAARGWARGHDADLTGTARDFLAASTRQQHRASRLRRAAVTALAVLTVIAVTTSAVALWQRGSAVRQQATAVQQRDQAVYNQTVAEALQLSGSNPALAAQLDIAAADMKPGSGSLSRLVNTENTPLPAKLTAGTSPIITVAFSPNSRIMASGAFSGLIRMWDVADPAHARELGLPHSVPFFGHQNPAAGLAFSPDGRMLAAATWIGMGLWDVADPAHPRLLGRAQNAGAVQVNSVAFSPDGRVLAGGDGDGTVRLWDVTDPAHPQVLGEPLTSSPSSIKSVAFSPAGTVLAAGGGDGAIRLWDVADPAQPELLGQPLTASTGIVNSVAFSPDGRLMAIGGEDGTVWLWASADPGRYRRLGSPAGQAPSGVASVAFSPDGHTLVGVGTAKNGFTGEILEWNVADPAQPRALGKPVIGGYAIDSEAFSRSGRILGTGDDDGEIQLWDLTDPGHPRLARPGAGRRQLYGRLDGVPRRWPRPGQRKRRRHDTAVGCGGSSPAPPARVALRRRLQCPGSGVQPGWPDAGRGDRQWHRSAVAAGRPRAAAAAQSIDQREQRPGQRAGVQPGRPDTGQRQQRRRGPAVDAEHGLRHHADLPEHTGTHPAAMGPVRFSVAAVPAALLDGAAAQARAAGPRLVIWAAMMARWTSLVPSQIRSTRSSR